MVRVRLVLVAPLLIPQMGRSNAVHTVLYDPTATSAILLIASFIMSALFALPVFDFQVQQCVVKDEMRSCRLADFEVQELVSQGGWPTVPL